MQKLIALVDELEKRIPDHEMVNKKVSASTVGWQIEHCLLTINLVAEKLKQSDPAAYRSKFNFWKIIILLSGKIPRGKVRAPKVVQPSINYTPETLAQHVSIARVNLASLKTLSPGHFFVHPYFGQVKLNPAIRFLAIHTNHHLKIINEILAKKV